MASVINNVVMTTNEMLLLEDSIKLTVRHYMNEKHKFNLMPRTEDVLEYINECDSLIDSYNAILGKIRRDN